MFRQLGTWALRIAMAFALVALWLSGGTQAAHAQSGRITDAQIADAVAQMHPIGPDIRLPTAGEMSLIYSNSNQALTPAGNFFRVKAHERLIEVLEKSFGPEHPLVGQLRLRLADQVASSQQIENAEAQLDLARTIIAARVPRDNLFHLAIYDTAQFIHFQRGDTRAQLAEAKAMQALVLRDFASNKDAQILALRSLQLANFDLGNYSRSVDLGAQRIALIESAGDGPSARLSAAIADQARGLIAAGRLSEGEELLKTRGASGHLDPVRDRYTLAALARARGSVAEAKLMFETAKEEYETAYRIYSAADFKDMLSFEASRPVDAGTYGAVRSALELKRLEVRKFNSAGVIGGAWRQDDAISLDLGFDDNLGDGPVLSTSLLKRSNVFRIQGPLQAIAARYNGFAYALGNKDHTLAEQFWRELVDYRIRMTGKDSVRHGEALVDLAGGLMAATRPFAAREEALKAIAILEGQLADTHPALVRARALAAIALSRQGRGLAARPEIEAALEAAWANAVQTKRELLALLVERDLQFQRERDVSGRAAFWEVWGERALTLNVGTGFVEIERLARVMLGSSQSAIDTGQCVPDEVLDTLFSGRETFRQIDDQDMSRFTNGPATYTLLLIDQTIAEALSCKPRRGYTLTTFLKELRDNQRYSYVRLSAQDLSDRTDRFARLLARSDAFGTDPETTQLAIEFAADAAYTANFQITKARAMGDVATSDDRLARVLASAGAGFDVRYGLETQLDVLWRASEKDFARGPLDESDFDERFYRNQQFSAAFKAAQLLRIDANSQALALASARAAAPNPQLRKTIAAYQTLSAELFRELSMSTQSDGKSKELEDRLADLDAEIRENFPAYYDFAAPRALDIYDARNALKDNEGLLAILPVGDFVYVFAMSESGGMAWHRFDDSTAELEDLVRALRCNLDPVECGENAAVQTRGGATAKGAGDGEWIGAEFDRNIAHELYLKLIAPVADALDSEYDFQKVKRLYVVTSGAISALPLSLLVTEPPSDDGYSTTGNVLLETPWLSDRYEIAYLPSISDLAGSAGALGATEGFIGFGDPVLGPPVENGTKGHRGGEVFTKANDADGVPLAQPEALLKLASLEGAERELTAVASLFPETSRLFTKTAATEPAVKSGNGLAGSQVILFSTHGVLPDPGLGNAEPGLVMTPPRKASIMDDGLLSASEAAALDFTSELLILSACNTATEGSFAGADSLSGLARSFIFAGARSVYASHWQVSDTITKELIFAAVDIALREPGLTRSEALAKAMRAIRKGRHEDGRVIEGWTPAWSHPSAWAPFVAIVSRERE